jgi:hypothetical protein
MISSRTLLEYVKAEPFRPFRIHMASGKTFDIRHPETIKVAKTSVLVFTYLGGEDEIPDHWETASLVLMESISYLDAPVAQS